MQRDRHLIVSFGRANYAFGLDWFSVDEDDGVRKHAGAMAKELGDYDLAVLRKDDAPQFALASRKDAFKPGTISAAAVVSKMVDTDNWLYVLEVENSIWMCYGSEGKVMPDGDRVYDSEEEAYRDFLNLEPARWKSLNIPASWRDPDHLAAATGPRYIAGDGTGESNLEEIFYYRTAGWMKLVGINRMPANLGLLAACGVLVAGAGMAWFVLGNHNDGPTPAEFRQQQEELAAKARAAKVSKFEEFDAKKPWNSLALASDSISNCLSAIKGLPGSPAGYELKSATCAQGSATGTYVNPGDTYAAWLKEWQKKHGSAKFTVNFDGTVKTAYITTDAELPDSRKEQSLLPFSDAATLLSQAGEISGATLTIQEPVVYHYDQYPDYVPLYGTSELKIETSRPEMWGKTLDRIQGSAIDTISFNPTSNTYTLEGSIYVSNR